MARDEPMMRAEDYWREPGAPLLLWAGLFVAPAAWALNLQANHMLSAFACEGWWRPAFHVVTLITVSIALTGVWLAWRSWQTLRDADGRQEVRALRHRIERSRFMAAAGLVLSAYFALTIMAQWIPALFIEPCVC